MGDWAMAKLVTSVSTCLGQIPGRGYLLFAVIIFAVANSVTRKLTDLGAQNLIDGRNPISFCNVLFVGNLCALITLIAIYHRQLTVQTVRQLSRQDWFNLIGVAVLAGALAPALFFTALDLTAVNNVVLIGRVEPPIVLGISVLLLREPVNRWVVAGAVLSFVGVLLTILLPSSGAKMMQVVGFQIGKGELLALGGAIAAAIATIISKISLNQIPFSTFNIFRTVIATVVFFVVVITLYGGEHFVDVFSPLLWQWMLLYGAVIVVGGQLSWFEGLKRTTASEVSLASSFSPIAGVLAAFLLLQEAPTTAQYIGGTVILLGIALNQIGVNQASIDRRSASSTDMATEMETRAGTGFKGI
jgi:drug/metabolite transporter (DMT)-like permease